MGGPNREDQAYGRLRRLSAGVVLALVVGLSVFDAASIEYEVSAVIVGLLLGSLLVLLGVEAGDRLLK